MVHDVRSVTLPSLKRFHLATLFGVALLVGLTLYWGAGGVMLAVASAGWGVALIILVRLAQILFSGVAWRSVVVARVSWWICPLLRWVREAIDVLLPVAQVGGEIIGARLLAKFGVPGATATASVLADMLVQVSTQLVFCLLGLLFFVLKAGDSDLSFWMGCGLLLFTAGVLGFVAAQRGGGAEWIEKRIVAVATNRGWPVPGGVVGLAAGLQAVHRSPSRLLVAAAIHMAIWVFGALEVWIGLQFLGQPVDFEEALVIESLSHAARAALFVVPGGIGIQEGAIIALGAAYGLSPQVALAVGLLKRAPDIVLGILGLMVWQGVEVRTARKPGGT
ncbi:lysylphosphatidylglycerol synthase domain-containing protein [Labrys monachus]|uniref:Membrane protein n=1 Tax=Labrys monachus TaxID=217067 RepID=A0ABU0FBM9_9HYPH|nr:lysylphosphatidylglycerol synthase domain-containing protein [Labrys monachus]MDQ0391956.1 putative membrane protein [Labrys monachus]